MKHSRPPLFAERLESRRLLAALAEGMPAPDAFIAAEFAKVAGPAPLSEAPSPSVVGPVAPQGVGRPRDEAGSLVAGDFLTGHVDGCGLDMSGRPVDGAAGEPTMQMGSGSPAGEASADMVTTGGAMPSMGAAAHAQDAMADSGSMTMLAGAGGMRLAMREVEDARSMAQDDAPGGHESAGAMAAGGADAAMIAMAADAEGASLGEDESMEAILENWVSGDVCFGEDAAAPPSEAAPAMPAPINFAPPAPTLVPGSPVVFLPAVDHGLLTVMHETPNLQAPVEYRHIFGSAAIAAAAALAAFLLERRASRADAGIAGAPAAMPHVPFRPHPLARRARLRRCLRPVPHQPR